MTTEVISRKAELCGVFDRTHETTGVSATRLVQKRLAAGRQSLKAVVQ